MRPERKGDNLTVISEPIVQKVREPPRFTTLWASRPITGIAVPICLEAYRFTYYLPQGWRQYIPPKPSTSVSVSGYVLCHIPQNNNLR
jgi:hypothetical protein